LQALLQDERTTRSHKEQYAALVSTPRLIEPIGGSNYLSLLLAWLGTWPPFSAALVELQKSQIVL
jgi:hypothetical protein